MKYDFFILGLPQQREEDTFLERPKQREKVRETAKTREIRKRYFLKIIAKEQAASGSVIQRLA